jgi:hypothetical protein
MTLHHAGLVVPASFLVGDVVDFVTRMSKLDRYSSKKTSRSLERIFVTGAFCVFAFCAAPFLRHACT